ncbi:MAG: DUF5681 domain-containing protein [Bacteroidales bacterium]|jgi:hypothetical protein|nr:DUF5681 domain-containing protein [Bacteroidales bacterium]
MKKANNPQNLKPFKKGVSGNPAGRPLTIPSIDILLSEVFTEKERISILTSLKKQAQKGNIRAIEIILDRLYGKVKQQTELSGSIAASPITGIQIIIDDSKA